MLSVPVLIMSASKNISQWQLGDDCVFTRKPCGQMRKDLKFVRDHPFYDEWQDWKSIVQRYYSPFIKECCECINRGIRNTTSDNDPVASYIADEVYWKSCTMWDEMVNQEIPIDLVYKAYQPVCDFYMNRNCECSTTYVSSPTHSDCESTVWHYRGHLLAFMWTYVSMKQPRKFLRKYYSRLQKVILSLPFKYLKNFDIRLIVEPPKFKGLGRNLLRELYDRGYFDAFRAIDFADKLEFYKHQIRQQGGNVVFPSQCYRENNLFVPGLIDLGVDICSKLSFSQLMDYFNPKEQGYFDSRHAHDVSDETINKFRNMLAESQASFFEGLKDTIMSSGKQLFVMFATATTISLLAKAAIDISIKIILKLLHWMYMFICGTDNMQQIEKSYLVCEQSGDEEDITIPFLPSMYLNYVISPPKNLLKQIWSSPETDKIMRRIGYLGDTKIDRGIERMINWVREVIRKIDKWFSTNFLGLLGLNAISSDSCEVLEWYEKVDEQCQQYFRGEMIWSDASFNVIYGLYTKGLDFTRQPAYYQQKYAIYDIVRKLGNILNEFKSKGISAQKIRNPPVTIYLYGGTGVGKSSITYPISAEILAGIFQREGNKTDLKKYWDSMIYMRAPEQEYWDGYQNQMVTVFDDFSQQRDVEANPNVELFEIIRSANCFPYPLHMASIEQKATTTFTSKIIIASSNLQRPQVTSLNFPDALRRRFDICVQVDRQFNGHTDKFDPSLYVLTEYNMVTGNVIGTLTYQQLIDKCVSAYFKRKNYVHTMEDYIVNRLDELMKPKSEDSGCQTDLSYNASQEEIDRGIINYCDYIDPNANASKNIRQQGPPIVDFYDCREPTPDDDFEVDFSQKNYISDAQDYIEAYRTTAKSCFEDLREQLLKFSKVVPKIQDWWERFRIKHWYVVKASMYIGVVIAGLMFLKTFMSLKNLFSRDDRKQRKSSFEHLKNHLEAKFTKHEGYNPPVVKSVRVEGYNQPLVKTAKFEGKDEVDKKIAMEGYNPAILRAKVEAETEFQYVKAGGYATAEGVKDLNADEIMMKCIRTNLYKMYESTCGQAIGHTMFLVGQICVMPRHFISGFESSLRNDPDASVHFEAVLLNRSFQMKIYDLLKNIKPFESPDENDGPVSSRDLIVVRIPTAINHTDASKWFCERNALSRTDCTDVMLPTLMKYRIPDRPCVIVRYAVGRSSLKRIDELPVSKDDGIVVRYVRDCWEYRLDTRATECGAPLVVRNTQINSGKICGIHIAGIEGTGQGYSTPIYYEDVVKMINMFGGIATVRQVIQLTPNEYPKEQCQIPEDAEFVRIGALSNPIAQVSKSKIIPSPIYGKIREPVTKPCVLNKTIINGEEFNPRTYRLGRLGNVTKPIDQDLVIASRDALLDEISSVIERSEDIINDNVKAVYSFEEAVLGIPGEEYISSIKRDTSAGFPFVTMKSFTRKDMFGNGQEYDLSSEQCQILRRRVDKIIENAKQGIALDHYFIDTLKDERKPIHKAHKTRLFSAGPIDYLIACKMYFNGVVALLSKSRNKCHVSVGTNVYSRDWDVIVKTLQSKSKKMVAGDFEGFDASQLRELLEACIEILIQLSVKHLGATEEDVKIMRTLAVSLLCSFHICGREIYQWTHSLPSGHYLTAIINSIFVNLVFGCIWQLAKNKRRASYRVARLFWKLCGITAYGDDHIVSIPESHLKNFNQETIPKLMSMLGLSYTMEDKDREIDVLSRPIEEITFLKRGFVYDEKLNQWIAPLDMNTILEFPMWNRSPCPDQNAETIVLLDKALEELSLHDRYTWRQWAPRLQELERKMGHHTLLKYQDDARLVCLGYLGKEEVDSMMELDFSN